jgi:hypothetical protein
MSIVVIRSVKTNMPGRGSCSRLDGLKPLVCARFLSSFFVLFCCCCCCHFCGKGPCEIFLLFFFFLFFFPFQFFVITPEYLVLDSLTNNREHTWVFPIPSSSGACFSVTLVHPSLGRHSHFFTKFSCLPDLYPSSLIGGGKLKQVYKPGLDRLEAKNRTVLMPN